MCDGPSDYTDISLWELQRGDKHLGQLKGPLNLKHKKVPLVCLENVDSCVFLLYSLLGWLTCWGNGDNLIIFGSF